MKSAMWAFTQDEAPDLRGMVQFLRQCRSSLGKQYDAAGSPVARGRLLYCIGELGLDMQAVRQRMVEDEQCRGD